MTRRLALVALHALLLGILPAPVPAQSVAPAAAERGARAKTLHAAPSELFDVERVVDGDTLHVRRDGKLAKLRLLSVDTEEKFAPGSDAGAASKPATVFGEECALWAQRFFADLAAPGEKPKVGLFFPGGEERLDAFGRVLCHVVLPDGTDYNLLLVELGKSPYFNKYGNSELHHDAFVAAQRAAREARLGIWSPETNEPATPGAPSAKRPYERLLPWWDARAAAVDAFRAAKAADAASAFDSDDPEELARAAELSKQRDVRVFGCLERTFDEANGTLTLLFKTQDRDRALRARIRADARPAFAALELQRRGGDFAQNYLWIDGRVTRGSRGFEIHLAGVERLRPAGPEPAAAAAAGR